MNTETLFASAKTGLKRAFDFFIEPSEEKKAANRCWTIVLIMLIIYLKADSITMSPISLAFRESVQVKFARIEAALTSAENTRNDVFNASTNRFLNLDEAIASSETQKELPHVC